MLRFSAPPPYDPSDVISWTEHTRDMPNGGVLAIAAAVLLVFAAVTGPAALSKKRKKQRAGASSSVFKLSLIVLAAVTVMPTVLGVGTMGQYVLSGPVEWLANKEVAFSKPAVPLHEWAEARYGVKLSEAQADELRDIEPETCYGFSCSESGVSEALEVSGMLIAASKDKLGLIKLLDAKTGDELKVLGGN